MKNLISYILVISLISGCAQGTSNAPSLLPDSEIQSASEEVIWIGENRPSGTTMFHEMGIVYSLHAAGTRYGLVTAHGEQVLPTEYKTIEFSKDSYMILVENETGFGFCDLTGSIQIPCTFKTATVFENGLSVVSAMTDDGVKYGVINEENEFVLPLIYEYLKGTASNSKFIIGEDEQMGLINLHGDFILPAKQRSLARFTDDTFIFSEGAFYGVKNERDQVIIEPIYRRILQSNDGIAAVQSGEMATNAGGWGYIDEAGNVIYPLELEYAHHFVGEYTDIPIGTQFSVINRKGEEVVAERFDQIRLGEPHYALAEVDGKHVLLDFSSGTQCEINEDAVSFTYLLSPYDSLFITDEEGTYMATLNGSPLTEKYDEMSCWGEGKLWVRDGNRYGIITNPFFRSASEWALSGLENALKKHLIISEVSSGFTDSISRLQFAQLVVNYVEQSTNQSLAASKNGFSDTKDINVLKAYHAGIVQGVDDGSRFNPEGSITREEVAVMLCRAENYIRDAQGFPYLVNQPDQTLRDLNLVSEWAVNSVNILISNQIFYGNSDGNFCPKNQLTIEQAILILLRAMQTRELLA